MYTVLQHPTITILTVAEAKKHLNIPAATTAFDDVIQSYIKAALVYCENTSWRVFEETQIKLELDSFPEVIELSRTPLITVDSVTYLDVNGVSRTVNSSDYHVDLAGGRIVPENSWPSTDQRPNAVTITFKAGFKAVDGNDADLPEGLLTAWKMMTAHYFNHRSRVEMSALGMHDIEASVDSLLAQESMRRF